MELIRSHSDVFQMSNKELLQRAIDREENSNIANSWIQNEILYRMNFYPKKKKEEK